MKTFRFRPNWIFQQLLKLMESGTKTNTKLILDADCILTSPLNGITEDGKIVLIEQPNPVDDPGFERFISRMTGGELGMWPTTSKSPTRYIADKQFMNKNIIEEMILRYFYSIKDFIKFTAHNTFWRQDAIEKMEFISEYELYGRYVVKFHSNEVSPKMMTGLQFNKYVSSQNMTGWTTREIDDKLSHIMKMEVKPSCLKLQTNCGYSDVKYATR